MKLKYYSTLIFMISIFKITAQSSYSLELNIKTIPTEEITKNETGIGFSLTKNLDTKNKITNSISYKNTNLNYSMLNYYSTDNEIKLNQIENDFRITHQFNSKAALNIEVKTVVGFENNLDFTDVSLLGGAEFQYAINSKNSIQIGIKRLTVFGKPQIFPILAYYKKLNENTAVELGFPNTKINYSNNIRNNFSLSNTFGGEFYKLDHNRTIIPNLNAEKISFSQMSTVFEYERNVDQNWFMNFQGGYQFNKKYALTNSSGATNFNFNANDGYVFKIGIKYKQ